MAQFETISHGEANWEQKVNKNFSNVVQDTGWQSATILAPATGSLKYRIINGVMYFINTIVPHTSNGSSKIALLPITGGAALTCIAIESNTVVRAGISDGYLRIWNSDAEQENGFAFDGSIILVVGRQSGGGSIPAVSTI